MYANKRILAGTLAAMLSVGALASESTAMSDAITNGEFHYNFRYRLESVDQDGIANRATASTLRTRLNYLTSTYRGFGMFLEAENVAYLGEENFNNTRNGYTNYPVVADPDGTDMNQFFIKYAGGGANAILGRQRVNLDNQRFVGGVGWRQNEQTYDALTVDYKGIKDTRIFYGYFDRVLRVFGPERGSPPPYFDSNAHVVNINYNGGTVGNFTGYGYLLDLDNAPGSSSSTIGVRYTNTFTRAELKFPVTLEYASQSEYADNPVDYSASYLLAEAGLSLGEIQFLVGNETLGSDSGVIAFSTPLATLHKFQGWADKFLSTPAAGVEDRYFTVKGSEQGTSFALTWHDFKSDEGSAKYGTEIDLSIGHKVSDNIDLLLKYARYNADTLATDTSKVWLMVTASF